MNKNINMLDFPEIILNKDESKEGKRKYKKTLEKKFNMNLEDKLEMCRMGVRTVTRGYKTSRLITGVPGVGKSYSVMDELKAESESEDSSFDLVYVTGGLKDARTFYQFLSENNDKNKVIVFDDVNTILKDKECVEILRCACENETQRVITFSDNVLAKNKRHKEKLKFHSKIIIITNIPARKLDDAIVSRTSPIDITASIEEIFSYVADRAKVAPPRKVGVHHKHDVLNFIKHEVGFENVQRFDFRVFEDACLWRAATDAEKEWKSYIYNLVVK